MNCKNRFSVIALFAALSLALTVWADQPEPLPYLDKLPKLLDRELFFGDPEISGAQLSPDGQYVTFMRPYRDVRNIWIKRQGESFDDARPLTADDRPVPGYFWTRDSGLRAVCAGSRRRRELPRLGG
jgi:hypothetical protein